VKRFALAAAVSVALAGCSSGTGGSGQATVWVTRDRGKQVLHVGKVPAGLTALQGLDRVAEIKTRYGGRYVRAVDGVAEHGRRSWFYYVNGYLADQGSAEYRLREGDVEWWDYRSWRDPLDDSVVVGSFPEPFLHGYAGKRRPVAVLYAGPRLRRGAQALAKLLHARSLGPISSVPPKGASLLVLTRDRPVRFAQEGQATPPRPGGPVLFVFTGDALELARHPRMFRFRYSVP